MSFIQKQFTKITIIIIQFAAFVCCSYCTWTRGTFVRDEHRRYSGRNGNNVQQALLTCQGEGIPDLGYDPLFVKEHNLCHLEEIQMDYMVGLGRATDI